MEARLDIRERPGRDAALFLLAALAFRGCFWFAMPRVIDSADAVHYLGVAEHFRAGDFFGYDLKIPVLYPLLGALFSLFLPDVETACQAVSLAASALLVIPVYFLSRELHGQSAARVAAVIVVIWTWLADYASRVSTEALACTVWFLAVWLFARGLRRGGVWPVAAASLFFALHLARPEGTFLLLAAFPAAAILCLGDDRGARKASAPPARARRLVPFAVTCAFLLAAYGGYLWHLTGTFTINYRTQYIAGDVQLANAVLSPKGTLLDFIRTTSDTLFSVLPTMLGPVLVLFMGVGLFQPSERHRDTRLELYLLFFAAAQWGVSLSVRSPAPRYLMAVIVALSLWSARGTVLVGRQAATLSWGRWLKPLPVVAIVAPMLFGTAVTLGAEHLGRRPREPREYKAAGLWMKEHIEPALVFTRKPQVGYYADMPTTGPAPEDTLDAAIDRARKAGARYFVVDERYTTQLVPALKPLLDPVQAPPDLRLLHEEKPPYPDARVVVYEIIGGRASPP